MKKRFHASLCGILALTVLSSASELAAPPDLTRIERAIAKQPAYQGKPRYGLAVFGPAAGLRVWLVLDNGVLFVDRNGNGDLTEAGERFPAQEQRDWGGNGGVFDIYRVKIPVAGQAEPYDVYLEINRAGVTCPQITRTARQGAGLHRRGELVLAERPQDAPILHFDGPLTLGLLDFRRGTDKDYVDVMVGTPGVGAGSTVMVGPENTKAVPVVEIDYPAGKNQPPLRVRVPIKAGCCGDLWYEGSVPFPAGAAAGKAKIHVRFPDWPGGKLADAVFEVEVR